MTKFSAVSFHTYFQIAKLTSFFILLTFNFGMSQHCYWQMQVDYDINVKMDVKKHQFQGHEILKIVNNSPDTLRRLFYHLYFNAFQPGSDMDERSRWIVDPDKRVGSRIYNLSKEEIGYQEIHSIKQGNTKLKWNMEQTILEVILEKVLLPNDSTVIEMNFEAQVPIQIRRSGRNNSEGIDYSMAQWYPKLCAYDANGWHANPYIGREFYGNWGDYNVRIELDANYCVAATGYQLNSDEVNCSLPTTRSTKKWHFFAPKVHDFVWAADPDYVHKVYTRTNGQILNFYYQENEKTENWKLLPKIIDTALVFIEKNFGPYPYKSYSFIQGGDGGMEYPMATLITGNRKLNSLVGVSIHELMHSWYQMLLATDEAEFPWMDEGFASYAEYETEQHLKRLNLIPEEKPDDIQFKSSIEAYRKLVLSGVEENLKTHADHYHTNYAYGNASYVKGALTLVQLEYLLGKEVVRNSLLEYYWTWRFKHPDDVDFFRIVEKQANVELDWFYEYWIESTKTVDYAIDTIYKVDKNETLLSLERIDLFPMPMEVNVETIDGQNILYYIPLDLMRGSKKFVDKKVIQCKPWHWVKTNYSLNLEIPLHKIKAITLDPTNQLVDIDPSNNQIILKE